MQTVDEHTLDRMNRQLADNYGYFDGVNPNWRIVWSNDQFEKRWTNLTPEGLELLSPVIREFPKYRQWNKDRYVLERLIPLPPNVDLVGKFSYEPVWTFEDKNGNYLVPKYEVAKIVIETVYHNVAKQFGVKYKDPLASPDGKAYKEQELDRLQAELFGNETDVTDALAQKDAIVVPNSYGD